MPALRKAVRTLTRYTCCSVGKVYPSRCDVWNSFCKAVTISRSHASLLSSLHFPSLCLSDFTWFFKILGFSLSCLQHATQESLPSRWATTHSDVPLHAELELWTPGHKHCHCSFVSSLQESLYASSFFLKFQLFLSMKNTQQWLQFNVGWVIQIGLHTDRLSIVWLYCSSTALTARSHQNQIPRVCTCTVMNIIISCSTPIILEFFQVFSATYYSRKYSGIIFPDQWGLYAD